MEQETQMLEAAIKAIEVLQNHNVYENKEIERQVNWGTLEQTLLMLKDAKANS